MAMTKTFLNKMAGMFIFCFLLTSFSVFAQKETTPSTAHVIEAIDETYDPLISQLFAFDKVNQIFVGINNVDNSIDIIDYNKQGELSKSKSILVDVFQKRHDVHLIYRPQSVAIYDDAIVYLASHKDSCFLSVLDLQGNEVKRICFSGKATAFSYSREAKELYVAGENELGYDIVAISVVDGFKNAELVNSGLHYRRPKKSETIKEKDPYGAGMAAVAMSVVFFALLVLFLSFKGIGNALLSLQNRKARKVNQDAAVQKGVKAEDLPDAKDISGDIYAALAAAFYMYNSELHDEENTVLTISKVSKSYSPWSSKIYGLNNFPGVNKK